MERHVGRLSGEVPELQSGPAAVGAAGTHTLIVDRPVERVQVLVDHAAEIAEIPLSTRDTRPASVSVRRVESLPTP